ncbi:MAG: hypothetical protein LBM70_05930 [Victivallales bacterium]|jgi:multidrug transporter EmrE-like cation transporter|nr:hypothetical protein [Victivallales bacterium]
MVLGISLLVATGILWVLTGAVAGGAARKNLPIGVVQACGNIFSISIGITILLLFPDPECDFWVSFWTKASLFGSGFLNYFVIQFMSKAMKSGPNGMVWVIIQSALIFPFMVGIICFGVPLGVLRLSGLCAIIFALVIIGLSRDNHLHGRHWLVPALAAFLFAGVNQNLASLPSYFSEALAVGNVSRSVSAATGTLTAFALTNFRNLSGVLPVLKNPLMWRYIACLGGSGIISGYLLMYRGLNLIAEAGVGAIGYPVMISSCIAAFTLYSVWVLKERIKPLQIAGLCFALGGIVLISLK